MTICNIFKVNALYSIHSGTGPESIPLNSGFIQFTDLLLVRSPAREGVELSLNIDTTKRFIEVLPAALHKLEDHYIGETHKRSLVALCVKVLQV